MLHEHFAEALAPTVEHQVRHIPRVPRSFRCSAYVAEEIAADCMIERMLNEGLFIGDQMLGATYSTGYTNVVSRYLMRGLLIE